MRDQNDRGCDNRIASDSVAQRVNSINLPAVMASVSAGRSVQCPGPRSVSTREGAILYHL